jgi:ADP-ribose pyrophosphatase
MRAWDVLRTEHVIQDPPWITLRKDHVQRGDLKRHYWILEQPTWVNVVAVTKDEKIVLVRQHRHGVKRDSLEIPGGYAETDDPLADAKRELREETGYGAGSWSLLQMLAPNPALQNNWMYTYLATDVEKLGDPQPDSTEELETQLVTVESIHQLISEGEIFHALHVAPLLVYASRR